jgi:hypothetical protein
MIRDPGLERLLDLDGFLAEIGGGYWVRIEARRVSADAARPHGIAYALSLFDPRGRRVFGIDNANLVRPTRGPAGRSRAGHDHLHRGAAARPYRFRDAETLDDFWRELNAILKQEGIE